MGTPSTQRRAYPRPRSIFKSALLDRRRSAAAGTEEGAWLVIVPAAIHRLSDAAGGVLALGFEELAEG
jgi:hypothetical protein